MPGLSFFCETTLELSVIQNLNFLSASYGLPAISGRFGNPREGSLWRFPVVWQCGAPIHPAFSLD